MRKLLLVTVVALGLALATTGVALADGGPHGGYTATTDACAGCHRTHTALGPQLLNANTTYDLCLACHGSAGLGANTNVEDGFYLSNRDDPPGGADYNHGAANTPDNAPLLGGGFVNYQGVGVSSSHDPSGATDLAWGYGGTRGVTAVMADGVMDCASCHDPHGSPNYRIFRELINGNAVAVAQVDEGAAKDYDTEQWGAGMSTLCAACHGAYHVTTAGSGSDAAYVPSGGYTHRIDMAYNFGGNLNPETVGMGGITLPLAESGVNDTVVCTTCHMAHGTAETMAGWADGSYDPFGGATPPGPIPSGDSALLRVQNRGVCEVCHQK